VLKFGGLGNTLEGGNSLGQLDGVDVAVGGIVQGDASNLLLELRIAQLGVVAVEETIKRNYISSARFPKVYPKWDGWDAETETRQLSSARAIPV
jgi:hypothetical protein